MSPASTRSETRADSAPTPVTLSPFPPPALSGEQAADLRADLSESGWGVEAV
ncbi:hypothetical protein HMPREF1979_02815, partial [Actinomyces johnsonii F0542]